MPEVLKTTCPLDCPDACALGVTVEDGKITTIGAADNGNPVTGGFICSKVRRFGERVYSGDRLLYPLRRSGPKGAGKFERITWDESIAEIAAKLRDVKHVWGGEAILPYHYGGSNGWLTDSLLDDLLFARLGASRLARTLCAAHATEVALGMYAKMPGVAFEDYPLAKFIVIWGANPKASNIHLVPFLREAKRRGAFVATVDPTQNFSEAEADLHLPVYPGADLPLALGMIRYWEEQRRLDREFLSKHAVGLETLLEAAREWPLERAAQAARVAADDIRKLADRWAERSPAVLRLGWGVERNRNAGQAMAAVMAMPALLGKFGVRGGGYTLSNGGAGKLDTTRVLGDVPWKTRELNMTQLGELLNGKLDPPVKALFVYNCNPAATVPDQSAVLRGLSREDLFTVLHEQVMTDTAAYADILLPATTFLEHYDIRKAYGSYVVGGVRPVIAPRGEARSNNQVFGALGRAMGFTDAPFAWDDATWVRNVAEATHMGGKHPAAEKLAAGGCETYDFPGKAPVMFKDVHPMTTDGKIHLAPECLGAVPYKFAPVEDAKYPLAMISPSTSRLISSTLGEFNLAELRVTLHPEDAKARNIGEGDRVRVFNRLGEVVCRAQVSERLRSGVVSMPKGAWRKASQNGYTATALCPATVSDVAGQACFNDARVEVEKQR